MRRYGWALDGYGRVFLYEEGDDKVLFCVLPGISVYLAIDALQGYCDCEYVCGG